MIGLQYEILRYIQWTPRSKEEICRRINRFRFKKIPSYLIYHMVDELEYGGLIEELSQAEIDKMLAGEDPDCNDQGKTSGGSIKMFFQTVKAATPAA